MDIASIINLLGEPFLAVLGLTLTWLLKRYGDGFLDARAQATIHSAVMTGARAAVIDGVTDPREIAERAIMRATSKAGAGDSMARLKAGPEDIRDLAKLAAQHALPGLQAPY